MHTLPEVGRFRETGGKQMLPMCRYLADNNTPDVLHESSMV
jgi:hypothetical protein